MAVWRSKLGTSYPKDLIERLDAEHHRTLKRLRQEPQNQRCAECGVAENTWASVNLGVFICTRCADVHRALGTHLSKVKGCGGTYLWGEDELARMAAVGNAKAADLYGARGAPTMARGASKEELLDFCQKKYGLRLWASAAADGPPRGAAVEAAKAPPGGGGGRKAGAPKALEVRPAPRPKSTSVARSVDWLEFDDFFEECVGKDVASAEPPRRVEASTAFSVHDLRDLLDRSGDLAHGCDDVCSPKATAPDLGPPAGRPAGPAAAWQPKGPESDDLWAEWGAW